ncbi:hypothetical protein JCM10450v2_005627 [Rhodotorula kratochvilovae]
MSLYCSISGTQPLHPVVSTKSGHVYEKDLVLKALQDNDGKDPISGEQLSADDLVDIKTAPSQPTAPPRAPTFTSVPSLLHTLQQEWDATMLECLELRRQSAELRQELSHALYKEDAAMRVLARVSRERDEAREALASVKATLGTAYQANEGGAADAQMEGVEQVEEGLPADARKRVEETHEALSATRRKRKTPPEAATADEVKTFVQGNTIPSLHTTKPPGIAALTLAKDGELIVTGGFDKNVIVYDRSTSKIVASLKGHTKKVTAVVASPSLTAEGLPSFIVSSSLDKSVRVWTPNGAKAVYGCTSNVALGAEVRQLALHPTGSLAVSAQADGTWAILDLAVDKPQVVLSGALPADAEAGTANTAVAVHPDGIIFAVGSSDARIRVFETLTGKCVAAFDGHSAEPDAKDVVALSFSENGYSLASAASGSSQAKVWDLRKLACTASIDLAGEGSGDAVVVNAVAWDYTGHFLAVAGADARVYANKTWALLAKSDDNAAPLTAVRWGKDSKELVVAGVDRTVRFLAAPASE